MIAFKNALILMNESLKCFRNDYDSLKCIRNDWIQKKLLTDFIYKNQYYIVIEIKDFVPLHSILVQTVFGCAYTNSLLMFPHFFHPFLSSHCYFHLQELQLQNGKSAQGARIAMKTAIIKQAAVSQTQDRVSAIAS